MSIRTDQNVIHLIGNCTVEDAETLLLAIHDAPLAPVDLSAVTRLHLAVAQILGATRPTIAAMPQDAFLRDLLLPTLLSEISA